MYGYWKKVKKKEGKEDERKEKSKGRKERGKEDGIYLAVQWLRLCASTAGVGHRVSLRFGMLCKKKKKRREEREDSILIYI